MAAPTPAQPVPGNSDALSPEPLPPLPPGWLQRLALWLHRSLRGLSDRVVPAQLAIFERSTGAALTHLLGAAARHGIADLLEPGPLAAEALSQAIGLRADGVHRMMRALAASGVFTLREDGRFENNRLSRALRQGEPSQMRAWCEYFASGSNLAAWGALEDVLRDGRSGFRHALGTSVWEWFEQHPGEREIFAHAMMGITVGQAPLIASLYPFAELRTVCDLGGGRGTLLSELLIRHPHLEGVLVDAPGVLDSAGPLLERRGVAGRVRRVPDNFFESVPPGADAYLLKNVLHDWNDERCVALLKVCRAATSPGQKVLVIETVTERTETRGHGPMSDVQMMVVCEEGRERGEADYARLLDAAGFQLARRFHTPVISVLEGVAR
jgi:hypothetical protein